MKYRMKNDVQAKTEKEQIINDHLLPGIREICVTNVAAVYDAEINELLQNIDKFEDQNTELDKQLEQCKMHNTIIKNALPEMDEQIKILQEQLEKMSGVEVDANLIQQEIFKPKSDIE